MAPRRQPAATLALLLSLLASVDRCNAECSRPATTPAGYDLSGVVETTLTQGATFDVTGVVCDSSGGFVASGAGPAASTCTTDATSYILSGSGAQRRLLRLVASSPIPAQSSALPRSGVRNWRLRWHG